MFKRSAQTCKTEDASGFPSAGAAVGVSGHGRRAPENRGICRRGTDVLPAECEAIAQAPADLPSWRAGLIWPEFRTDMHVFPAPVSPYQRIAVVARHLPDLRIPAVTTDPPQRRHRFLRCEFSQDPAAAEPGDVAAN